MRRRADWIAFEQLGRMGPISTWGRFGELLRMPRLGQVK
jgi:hypothetical protein